MKTIKFILGILIFNGLQLSAQSFIWNKVNNLYGGITYSLMKDSANSVYCGTIKGIYKSNTEKKWELISNKKHPVELTFLNQNYFLAAFFDKILCSTNQGLTWDSSLISSPYGSGISCIYAKTNKIITGTSDLTILISSDLGVSWKEKNLNYWYGGYSYDFITAVELIQDTLLFVGSDGSGLIIYNMNDSLGWPIHSFTDQSIFDILAIDPYNIYYGSSNGIFHSTNIGQTWINLGLEERKIYSLKFRNNYFYAGSDSGLYKSIDQGLSWQLIKFGNIQPTIHDILFVDSETICLGTSFGTYFSYDNGNTWFLENSGIDALSGVLDILTINDTIYVASLDGLYQSFNNGQDWERKGAGLKQNIIVSLTSDDNQNIYAGTNLGICKSSDFGENWEYVLYGNYLRNVWSNNDILFASKSYIYNGNGLYRSVDYGLSWELISEVEGAIISYCNIDDDYILAGGDKLYMSSDKGISWDELTIPPTGGGGITSIKYYDGYIYICNEISGIFVSKNLGVSWDYLGLELLGSLTSEVYKDLIFIGVRNGINNLNPVGPFLSTNLGLTWSTINNGLYSPSVLTFSFDKDGFLLAGSIDGIYKSTNVITETSNKYLKAFNFAVYQNYPNPFNPTTKIKYSIPSLALRERVSEGRERVLLKIYDVLGNEIATLVNEEKPPGEYEVEFDAAGISSGIYFYKLTAGSFIQTKKMILLR